MSSFLRSAQRVRVAPLAAVLGHFSGCVRRILRWQLVVGSRLGQIRARALPLAGSFVSSLRQCAMWTIDSAGESSQAERKNHQHFRRDNSFDNPAPAA